jgi:phosphomannomutase
VDLARPSAPAEKANLIEDYATHVRGFLPRGEMLPLKVVADTANGMGGLVVPVVFDTLPFELDILFGELDGNFPNHPADPIQPANLVDLKKAVLDLGADVGLAFDGDADRVFLVDEKAQVVSGSLTTALVAKAMLERDPGATILYNIICSRVVPETIAEYGGTGIRTRVGHSFIKQVMAETNAVFGGEHSGHYYFRDNFRADSGIIAAMVVLGMMSTSRTALSELLAPFRRYSDSGEVNLEHPDPAGAVEAVAESLTSRGEVADRTDGLTVEHPDWWFNLRPSNTEPLLRLNVEARTDQACESHVREVIDLVSEATGTVPVPTG